MGRHGQPVTEVKHADSGTATIVAEGLTSTRWKRMDRSYRLALDAAVGKLEFSPDRARSTWAGLPVALPGPDSVVYPTTLHLPDGGKGFALEGDRTLPGTLAGARLRRTVTHTGDTIQLRTAPSRSAAR